jgi:hypothetical protein
VADHVDAEKVIARARAKLHRGKRTQAGRSVAALLFAATSRRSGRKPDTANLDQKLAAARAQLRAARGKS